MLAPGCHTVSNDHPKSSVDYIDFDVTVRVPDEPALVGQVGHLRLEGEVDFPALDAGGDGFIDKTMPVVDENERLFVGTADDLEQPHSMTRTVAVKKTITGN